MTNIRGIGHVMKTKSYVEKNELKAFIEKVNIRSWRERKTDERALKFPYVPPEDYDDIEGEEITKSHDVYEGLDERKKKWMGEILLKMPTLWFNKKTVKLYALVCRCTNDELSTWMYNKRYRILQQRLPFPEDLSVITSTKSKKSSTHTEEDGADKCSSEAGSLEPLPLKETLVMRFKKWPKLRDGEAELLAMKTGVSIVQVETIFNTMYLMRQDHWDHWMKLHMAPGRLDRDPDYAAQFRKLGPDETSSVASSQKVTRQGNYVVTTTVTNQPKGPITIKTKVENKQGTALYKRT